MVCDEKVNVDVEVVGGCWCFRDEGGGMEGRWGYGNYPQNLVVWARDLATRLWVSMHGICGICGVLFGYVG